MIANLMALSVRARWAVVAFFLVVAGVGAWQLTRLPIDAVPDITNNQVQINTVERGLSPIEIEKRVTFPIETALADGSLDRERLRAAAVKVTALRLALATAPRPDLSVVGSAEHLGGGYSPTCRPALPGRADHAAR